MESQQRIQQIEQLIHKVETEADEKTRAAVVELVQSLMEFHGAGIERMMEIAAEKGESGFAIIDDFGRDELVRSLLFLYGQHPVSLEERVMQGLDEARPFLLTHDGNVELLGINDGVVHLRLKGNCDGCPSSADTLKLAIEKAVLEAAPDVLEIVVEGVVEEKPATNDFVQIGKSNGNRFTHGEFPAEINKLIEYKEA